MRSVMDDVAAFHHACGQPVLTKPVIPDHERKSMRFRLIDEEVNRELLPALVRDDLPEIADAIADSIYVLVGTALEYGIPLEAVWSAVQKTNMAKVDPVTGLVRRREDGKILKPDGWTPPDVAAILAAA